MDISILIAALGLLVSALEKVRKAWRDISKDQVKPVGVTLIQLVFTLDRIIDAGDQLVEILSNITLKDEKVYDTLSTTKGKILNIIKEQRDNLVTFGEFYYTAIDQIGPQNAMSFGSAIEFHTSTKPVFRDMKSSLIDAVEWKLLDKKSHFQYSKSVLHAMEEGIEIDDGVGSLVLHFPTKIQVGVIKFVGGEERVVQQEKNIISYDLTKRTDIQRLLENSSKQLTELKSYRQQLAEFIQSSFLLNDLLM